MRAFSLTVIASMACSAAIVADPPPSSEKSIKPGMSIGAAHHIMALAGLTGHEVTNRDSDVEFADPDFAARYFPMNRNLGFALSYTKSDGKVFYLGLQTMPSYQPVKGLEVSLPLLEIVFHADGSYTAHFKPPNESK